MTTTFTSLSGASGPEFATHAAVWLLDAGVKSALLLLATGLAAWLLRRRSAATVHRVWTLGFCGCLLVPAATYFAPLGTLPVIPDLLAGATDRPQPAMATSAAPEVLSTEVFVHGSAAGGEFPHPPALEEAAAVTVSQPAAEVSAPSSGPAVVSAPMPQAASPRDVVQWSWPKALLIVWLGGVAVCVLRSAWQHWSLRRVMRRCAAIESESWTSAVAAVSEMLGFTRRVHLVQCAELRTPAVTGLFRTVVLVPGDAESWTPERRQLVLLHELGHAQRRDLLAHAIARLVCAVHWFNPLCWLGLSQMGKLRELACDDLVLSSGQKPVDYADVLLDVARSYQPRGLGVSVGMARRANVEDRILAILDRAQNRMLLSPHVARRWLVTTVAVVVLLGSLRLSSQAEPAAQAPGKEKETATHNAVSPNDNTPKERLTEAGERTIVVRIMDEEGLPLPAASIFVNTLGEDGGKRFQLQFTVSTNTDGIAEAKLSRGVQYVQMWPSKDGYVSGYVKFEEGTDERADRDRRPIPDRYEFRLAKGTEIGGTVVNEDGSPIEGVKVEVMVKLPKGSAVSGINSWLKDSVTNADGKWSTNVDGGSKWRRGAVSRRLNLAAHMRATL